MRHLIVGNSAAATGAIESIRAIDKDAEIILVANEPQHVYSRPLISYYLSGKTSREQMYFRPADFYEKNQVKTYLGEAAVRLSTADKTIHLKPSGLDIGYDRLLIATGGKPVIPGCFAGDYTNLFHFHQWQDIEKIAAQLKTEDQVLIIGAGLIGLKAAESLCKRGMKVNVLEAATHVLPSVLDKEAGDLVKRYLAANGVEVTTGNPVAALHGNHSIDAVVLADGTELSCDLVIMAAGVRPNVDWLNRAVKIEAGIVVDQYMCSSEADVYAAGDVVQSYDPILGEQRVMPLWPFAYRQGRIAGENMAGNITSYHPEPAFNSLPLLGLNIATAGVSAVLDDAYEYFIEIKEPWYYKKLVICNNRLKGFIFTGDISRCGIYRFLIEEEIDLGSFKEKLLKPDFGMIDLPVQYRQAE